MTSEKQPKQNLLWVFLVTGTFHGSHIVAATEGEARRAFHRVYNGESILSVNKRPIEFLLNN